MFRETLLRICFLPQPHIAQIGRATLPYINGRRPCGAGQGLRSCCGPLTHSHAFLFSGGEQGDPVAAL